jgi:hypothetical protein
VLAVRGGVEDGPLDFGAMLGAPEQVVADDLTTATLSVSS